MKFKPVMRYDSSQHKFRLFRLLWINGVVGRGEGYSAKLSVSLRPKWFDFWREFQGWQVTLLGVAVHKKKSYGGYIGGFN